MSKRRNIINRASILLFFLLLPVSCLLFPGCSPKPQASSSNTITVWHWMTDRDKAFQELAEKYKQETGIDVSFKLFAPSDVYSKKVIAGAQTNTLPDIYGFLGEKRQFASFIKSGMVFNLTGPLSEYHGEWKDSFFEHALKQNEFEENNSYDVLPGYYGVPIDVTSIQMIYNKKLFEKAGLDPDQPPQTWEEFIQAGKKLKQAGSQGLVSGWGETWLIDCFASNYAFNVMGEEKVFKTIKGEVSYTDPDWIKVFSLFKELRDNNMLASGVVTMLNKHAEQVFAVGKAAFAFNGSWCVNVYKEMNPELDFGVFMPPALNSKYPLKVWGGAGSSFIVNARSNVKEKAVDFLRWLTSEKQQSYLARETKNLPANRSALAQAPSELKGFADVADRITHPSIWPLNESPAVIEVITKGIQSIIIGEETPQQVAEHVEAVKEREINNSL